MAYLQAVLAHFSFTFVTLGEWHILHPLGKQPQHSVTWLLSNLSGTLSFEKKKKKKLEKLETAQAKTPTFDIYFCPFVCSSKKLMKMSNHVLVKGFFFAMFRLSLQKGICICRSQYAGLTPGANFATERFLRHSSRDTEKAWETFPGFPRTLRMCFTCPRKTCTCTYTTVLLYCICICNGKQNPGKNVLIRKSPGGIHRANLVDRNDNGVCEVFSPSEHSAEINHREATQIFLRRTIDNFLKSKSDAE